MKHTPGPWIVAAPPVADYGASMAILAQSPKTPGKLTYVAEAFKTDDDVPRMTQDAVGMANARLMAAAPELLAVCKDMLDKLDRLYPNDWQGTKGAAMAAIDAATGC